MLAAGPVGWMRGAEVAGWLAIGAVALAIALLLTVWRLLAASARRRGELQHARAQIEYLGERLDAQRSQMESLNEAVEVALFICDEEGVIHFANRCAREMFAFDEPLGKTLLSVSLSYDLHSFLQDFIRGGTEPHPYRKDILLSYPSERAVSASAWEARSAPGQPASILVSLADITPLRRLERVRTDFVANVSHELRTPMAMIRAMTETMLDDDQLTPETRERYLNKIIAEVDRLTLISDDLLTLASAESQRVEPQTIDLTEVLRYAVQRAEPQIREKGLRLESEIAPGVAVSGDSHQLVQVFENLISNAIRYTNQGEIGVRLEARGIQAVVEVKDTGIGIASEHLPRIFERFYRVDRARSAASGGTGLGLSIVRHIVDAHGGQVEVESEMNVGSAFRVRLPLAQNGMSS